MKKILMTLFVVLSLSTFAASAKVIGKVNGIPIYEKEANRLLKVLTKGKVKYSQLSPKDKKEVIKRIGIDKLVIRRAYKEIPKRERDLIIANAWLAKKIKNIKVSDKEARRFYNKNKHLFKKNGKILPYSKVKNFIKIQLRQKKVIDRLIKRAKIQVLK